MLTMNLLVLRTSNLTLSLHFYECLGLSFTQEQHGNGPVHYSSNINGMILELYPASLSNPTNHSTRLGFYTEDLEELCTILNNNNINFQTLDCYTIITQDPDGRKVHITNQ